MRSIRKAIVVILSGVGLVLVVGAALVVPTSHNLRPHLTLVLIGVVLIELAGWRRSNPFLPNERRYHDLREEVNGFMAQVRSLNRVSAGRDGAGVDEAERTRMIESLHASVDRIGHAAGREHGKNEGDA